MVNSMLHWNYRVIKKQLDPNTVSYQIHEVYYSDSGTIETWTESPVEPYGETEFELREDIRYYLRAFRLPVLEEKADSEKPTLVEESYDYAINPGHYFEFMDRTSVALDYVYQFLGNHPLLRHDAELKRSYDRVEEALAELYQLAGKKDFEASNG